MTKQELLNEAVNDLESIAALVGYQTSDRELTFAILDCAEQLARLTEETK
jgi:hypothetical protein